MIFIEEDVSAIEDEGPAMPIVRRLSDTGGDESLPMRDDDSFSDTSNSSSDTDGKSYEQLTGKGAPPQYCSLEIG